MWKATSLNSISPKKRMTCANALTDSSSKEQNGGGGSKGHTEVTFGHTSLTQVQIDEANH